MNLLWVITTQWRAQACGYAGNQDVTTPALDALALRSVDFTQAVTPHPFGPFARAALLTGVESPQNGVRDYFDPLPLGTRTLAHVLNDRGYVTAFFGKWHLAKRDPSAPLVGEAHARMIVPPEARGGFGFWEGFEGGFQLNDPWLQGTRLPTPVVARGYQSDVLAERVAEWVEMREKNRSWFCVLSLEPPHPPYDQAPQKDLRAPAELHLPSNVPRGGAIEARVRRELAGYYGHIAATDRALGRLLERIDERDTAIVFTSVHGDMHGAHGLFRKGWPYEESVRVPLLIQTPGGLGERRRQSVSLVELPAISLALLEEGMLPDRKGEEEPVRISMPSVVELPDQCDRVWRGLRSPKRKLILNADDSPWLFFDLEKDPEEEINLVGSQAHEAEIREWTDRLRAREVD